MPLGIVAQMVANLLILVFHHMIVFYVQECNFMILVCIFDLSLDCNPEMSLVHCLWILSTD